MKWISGFLFFLLIMLTSIPVLCQDFKTDTSRAMEYYQTGKYAEAAALFSKWLPVIKEANGENDTTVYDDLLSLAGECYCLSGQYDQAEPLMKEAVRINKGQFGENNTNYATAINNLAELYLAMGRYEQAEVLMKQAVRIFKDFLGADNPTYASAISDLAQLYQATGRYEQAETLMIEVRRIDKEALGQDNPGYGIDLNNLAALYLEMGRYDKAEPLMIETTRIDKEALGQDHPDYGIDLNNLALIYLEMGRYDKAEPLMMEAMRITKEALGQDHPAYGIRLNNLANLYLAMGQYEQAEPLMVEAMQIDEKALGQNHPYYGRDLNNLALLYQKMGRYEQAETLMVKAIQIIKEAFGQNHTEYGQDLNNLAILYQVMGRYEQAVPLMIEVTRIFREQLGENHPYYGISINNLAKFYLVMGRYEQAEQLMKEALTVMKKYMKQNSGYLSEKELKQFLETFLYNLEDDQSYIFQRYSKNLKAGDFSLDIELFRKGILLKSVMETRKIILESNDTALISSFTNMMTLRKQAEELYSMPAEKRYLDPDSLQEKANEKEKELSIRSKQYRQSLEETDITWKKVQDNLKPDEAIVEFTGFRYYNKRLTDSTLYCAIVLSKHDTIPKMIYLCEEKQLKAISPPPGAEPSTLNLAYRGERGFVPVPDSGLYMGGKLYSLVWQPFDSLLKGVNTVYFAPSGLLNSISLAAIPAPDGRLLSEKYRLVQVSSTRSLAIPPKEVSITDAVVFGGITYSMDTTQMITESNKYHKRGNNYLAYNTSRAGTRYGFDFLENTMKEAKEIAEKMEEKNLQARMITGSAAVEESFKALSGPKSPSIIHIATHGFYYPYPEEKQKREQAMLMGTGQEKFSYSEDPLLRSGLVMAGANQAWSGEPVPAGSEDGILTAMEVSEMNLQNTQLVVLSACQTGLGDVKGSEGVEGLQRAFKMAGVKYLILSLWEIPDEETVEFMETFYSQWLGGQEIRNAFQTTQQQMHARYPDEPYKWAAFVLIE